MKGGVYTINSAQGLNFTSGNWKIDEAEFIYNPVDVVFAAGDFFNTGANFGAVLMDFGSILNSFVTDFGVGNSSFYSPSAQRPPFVAIYSASGVSSNIFENGRFVNNTFSDDVAVTGLCYAFVNGNTPDVALNSPYFEDILISDTKINSRQGILVSGRATPNPSGMGYIAMNNVLIENFTIRDNRFGYIGFNVNAYIASIESGRFIIDNNKAEIIYSGVTATLNPITGTYADTTNSVTGNAVSYVVHDNDCYNMKIEASSGPNLLKSNISDNTIRRWDAYILGQIVPDPMPWAMIVVNSGVYPTNVTIADNTIDGFDGLTSGYMHNIYVVGAGASITGNTINNISGVDLSVNPSGSGAGGWGIYVTSTTAEQNTTIVGNTINRQDGVGIAGYIHSDSIASIYGNTFSHFNLASWSGVSTDGYGDLSNSNFNGITGPGASFAAWNVNQVVRTVPNMASAIPIFHITPETGVVIDATENDERLLYGAINIPPATTEQGFNLGLRKVSFNEQNGWQWQWTKVLNTIDPFILNNDGTVGLIIPISSVVPDRAYLLSLSVTITFSPTAWDIWDNGNLPAHTTFPEVALELNGNIVAWENPNSPTLPGNSPGHITLIYQSEALVNGVRPSLPLIKEVVVRMRQGTQGVTSPQFGGWVGPAQHDSHGKATMTISQPWITYLY